MWSVLNGLDVAGFCVFSPALDPKSCKFYKHWLWLIPGICFLGVVTLALLP